MSPGPALEQRYRALGTTCLVLGILELCYCAQKIAMQLFMRPLLAGERSLLPSGPRGPSSGAMFDQAQALSEQTAPWEVMRTIPFVVATGMLLFLAVRLRRGDGRALHAARQWTFAALGAVAVSLLIQIVAIVPPTLEYQRDVFAALPATPKGKAKPPFDVKAFTSSMTVTATLSGVLMGTAFMSAWPIVLFVWSGTLLRAASAKARAEAEQV
jgi:hypothetical protein